MESRKRALDVIRKANKKREVRVDFEMEIGGEKLTMSLRNPDLVEIKSLQELSRQRALAQAKAQGLDGYPIDEDKWQAYLNEMTEHLNRDERRRTIRDLEKEKPGNLAEQYALEAAKFETIRSIVPTMLYCGDELLFKTEEELSIYRSLIRDVRVVTLLSQKFVELMGKYSAIEEAAKNSQPGSKLN